MKYLALHSAFLLYSFSGVLSKMASYNKFMSLRFVLLYGSSVLMLVVYSVAWQLLLRKYPLNTAYSNKGIVVIWGIIWGFVFFAESINVAKIIAACLVIAGIVVIGVSDDE